MASLSLLQELGSNEIIKKSRAYVVNPGGRKQEILREISFNLKPQHLEPWKPFCSLSKSNEFDSTMMKPRLIDVHESTTKPLLDLMVDGNILFSSSRADLNDMVSIATEFHMLRNSTRWRKLSRLVPQLKRFDSEIVIETLQSPEVKPDAAVTQAPPKSPEKTRLKPSAKKQNPKIRDREKDLFKRNQLHACESLISLMLGNEEHRKTTLLSLKKSREDLSELLTQLSIGFAGTGMAVFFSVACNVASRVPFCENKVFDSALSLSLVLLSWAVSRLREAIDDINKKAINEEEIKNRVERRIKEVYLRAAIALAIVALRFG